MVVVPAGSNMLGVYMTNFTLWVLNLLGSRMWVLTVRKIGYGTKILCGKWDILSLVQTVGRMYKIIEICGKVK